MIDRTPPTRAEVVGRAIRETALVTLAFVAGLGGYFGALKEPPRWPQDYYAAIGAGALLALAKMIPSGGGGQRG